MEKFLFKLRALVPDFITEMVSGLLVSDLEEEAGPLQLHGLRQHRLSLHKPDSSTTS